MGLWTVRHILLKHGGDVRVESRPAEGTRVEIVWPRVFAGVQAAGTAGMMLSAAG
jgi:signal transduction histidine kinase